VQLLVLAATVEKQEEAIENGVLGACACRQAHIPGREDQDDLLGQVSHLKELPTKKHLI
jgi:hypothetical protein